MRPAKYFCCISFLAATHRMSWIFQASLLEELRAAGAGAPAAFEQATIFFELLFARAVRLTARSS